ncbi:MAG: DUF192 domain-containing protein [Nanoarchaeota archaeon]
MKSKFIILFLLVLISACSQNKVIINKNIIKVEVADTPEERSHGLMFRESLCDNCGMLFVFENEDYHNFWMKNTVIPLDMIFISEDNKIIDIIQAEPCKEDPCQVYKPKEKAKYILEVNKEYSSSNNLRTGDNVKISL